MPRNALEDLTEIRSVGKADLDGNFLHGGGGAGQHLFGFGNAVLGNVFGRRHLEDRQKDRAVIGLSDAAQIGQHRRVETVVVGVIGLNIFDRTVNEGVFAAKGVGVAIDFGLKLSEILTSEANAKKIKASLQCR